MSTNYRINDKRHTIRLELLEHSNVFDLGVRVPDAQRPDFDVLQLEIAEDLTFADLRALRDNINKVLGYFDEQDPPCPRDGVSRG